MADLQYALQGLLQGLKSRKDQQQALIAQLIQSGQLQPSPQRQPQGVLGSLKDAALGPNIPQPGGSTQFGGASWTMPKSPLGMFGTPEQMKARQEATTQQQSPMFEPALAYTRNAIAKGANPSKLVPQLSSRYQQPEQRKAITDLVKSGGMERARYEKSQMDTSLKQNAKDIAEGVKSGNLPPDLNQIASWKDRSAVAAELKRQGVNLPNQRLEWIAAQKYVQSKEGPQQLRLRQAISSVRSSIINLRDLNKEFQRTNYAPVNRAQILADANSGNSLAVKYLSQLGVIQDELSQVFMGGNAPTDKFLQLAQKTLSGNYSVKQLSSVLDTLDDNLGYRQNAIDNVQMTPIGGQPNIYGGGQAKQGKLRSGLTYTVEQ